MSEEVTALVDVLITKMERMDSDIDTLKGMVSNPEALLKQAGFVKAVTPATSDVWGDPLRGDRDEVIEKAAIAIDGVMVNNMPEDNAQWHEMGWDDIHAMAEQAAQAEGRPVDV